MNFIKNLLFKNISFKYSKFAVSVNLKPTELNFSSYTKALCLAPHADDETIGMAGVLCKFNKHFDVILLTDGQKGIKNKPVEEIIKIRENEFVSALKIAGIDSYSFLRAQDKHLIDNWEKFGTIELKDYDYIFVPNIIDQHPDHKAANILLKKHIKESNCKKSLKICFYEVWAPLGMTNAYVDISDVTDKKRQMINCYKSQIASKDYEYYSLALNAYRGMFKDKKFVEAFCVMEVTDFIKICDLY